MTDARAEAARTWSVVAGAAVVIALAIAALWWWQDRRLKERIFELESVIARLEDEIDADRTTLTGLRALDADRREELDRAAREREALNEEMREQARSADAELEAERARGAALSTAADDLGAHLTHLRRRLAIEIADTEIVAAAHGFARARLEETRRRASQALTALADERAQALARGEAAQRELKAVAARGRDLAANLEDARERAVTHRRKLAELFNETQALKDRLATEQARAATLEAEVKELAAGDVGAMRRDLLALTNDLARSRQRQEIQERDLEAMRPHVARLRAEAEAAQAAAEAAAARADALQSRLDRTEAALRVAQEEASALRARLVGADS